MRLQPSLFFAVLLASSVDARRRKHRCHGHHGHKTKTSHLIRTSSADEIIAPSPTLIITTSSTVPSQTLSSAVSITTSETSESSQSSATTVITSVDEPTTAETSKTAETSETSASDQETSVSTLLPEITTTSASTTTSSTSVTSTTSKAPSTTAFVRNYPADKVDELRDASIPKLEAFLGRNSVTGCTLENAARRYEWSDLAVSERQDYVKAVECLQNLPAKTPKNVASGARSRFDDFVVTHIQQTGSIHNTGNFLAWHRLYTWAYETALRDECGYKGYQPYWNWDRYANDPQNSPIFNGNSSSLGGNSVNGGCADTGPFKSLNVNLGPGSSLSYNPRCLKRSISRDNAQQCTADKTLPLITDSRDVGTFQERMQTPWGVHAGGHFTIGGDPGGDIFVSPGDPVFYLHHAMIDRVWWIWQLQDLDNRQSAVAGSVSGSSRQASLTDKLNLGAVAGDVALGELLDTMGGKGGDFCYVYM